MNTSILSFIVNNSNITNNNSNITNNGTNVTDNNNITSTTATTTRSDLEKVFFTIGLSLLIVVTIFGNTLVIMSFYMCRSLRTYTNYFIVSLSLSDILVAVISIPLWITFLLLNFKILDGNLSRAWLCFDIMTGVASIWNLTAVSVDRCIHISRPLTHSKLITKQRVLTVIVIIWILSCAISLVKGFHFRWEKPNYEMLVSCAGFFLPMVIIVFCYLRIYRVVRKQLVKFSERSKCLHSQKPLKTDVKAIKMIAIVVLAVFICWGPFFITNIWYGWCLYHHGGETHDDCRLNKNVIAFIKWLHYANSAINPIIYACFNREFRNGFKIALYKRLSTSQNLSNIINRTSFRDTFHSVYDAVSPSISSRARSRTLDVPTEMHLNGDLGKRHSIAAGYERNSSYCNSKFKKKTSADSYERKPFLTPRISM